MPLKMPVKYVAASREKVLENLRRAYLFKPDAKSRINAENLTKKLLRATNDKSTQIGCFLSLGRLCRIRGETTEALRYIDKAVDLCREINDDPKLVLVRYAMGVTYSELPGEDKLNASLRFFVEAERLAKKINNKKFLADIYRTMSGVLLKQAKALKGKGKMKEADEKLEESLRVRFEVLQLEKETGVVSTIPTTYAGIAAVKQEQGKLDEAIEITLKFCIPLAKREDIKGVSFFNLGDLYKDKGKLKKGLGYVLRGRAIFEGIGHAKYLAHANNVLQKELNASEILSSIDLTEEEERVARVRVAELKSLDEAANELGLSVQRIKELEEQVIQKLLS